jgi:type I restriction enzyme S subunit
VIEGLKPYVSRQDSGIPWVGLLPKHWQIFRAKVLFREVDERSVTGAEELLSVSHISGVRRRSELNANMFLAKSNKGHKLCRPNDLVINTMWAWMGALGISSHVGIVSPSYGVYRPHGALGFVPQYIHHLLRTPAYVAEYTNRSTGIHSSRLRLYPDQFLRIPIVLPPLDEQSAIVRFLDHANRRIERYIRSKRTLIALLNEQKQVIIHRTVTRGLDPNVPTKDSGVPWLGEIPAHWAMFPMSVVAEVVDPNPSHRNPTYTSEGFPFISTVEFAGTDDILLDTPRRVAESTVIEQERRCRFRLGSIAFSRKGTIGAARILPQGVRFALLDSVCVINCKDRLNYEYLYRQLSSGVVIAQLGALVRGAALKQVSVGRVRGARVVVPPLEEQLAITRALGSALPPIGDAISRAEREIALMREYRTRLVTDVVTGQLDVRGAVRNLPDIEAEAPAAESDPDEADLFDEDVHLADGEAA